MLFQYCVINRRAYNEVNTLLMPTRGLNCHFDHFWKLVYLSTEGGEIGMMAGKRGLTGDHFFTNGINLGGLNYFRTDANGLGGENLIYVELSIFTDGGFWNMKSYIYPDLTARLGLYRLWPIEQGFSAPSMPYS